MRRRDFITLLGGAAAWPLAARAQQTRRIGVMIALPEHDPELKKWLAAFREALERLGWSEGRNIHLDYRFAPAGIDLPIELGDVDQALSCPRGSILAISSAQISRLSKFG
jgi:hypothetical protein